MGCCEFKGGIGTSSRLLPAEAGGYALGVLVMSNFGRRENLVVDGVPVGKELRDWNPPAPGGDPERQGSSIIIVVATDAPLNSRQLERLSVRAGGGLARTGGLYSTSSGDFVIAFSTTNLTPHHPGTRQLSQGVVAEGILAGQSWPSQPPINHLFQAALEATEEAILNSMFAAETMVGRDGHVRHAIPIDEVMEIMRRYGRAAILS
jgi:D-aminopeptidase